MILGHSIALDATAAQEAHFRRASGTARYAFNWALAKWKEMYAAGEKPSAIKIKTLWNAHRRAELPWTYDVTKSASGQAVIDVGTAFTNFFRGLKAAKGTRRSRFPRFKSKRSDNGFALWNDQFEIIDDRIRIPKLGWVRMHERLRFEGKIMGARVCRRGNRWHVSIQVDVGDVALVPALLGTVVGIDLGITSLMTLSQSLPDGSTTVTNPRARKTLLKRQAKLQRRISRQELVRRKTNAKSSRRQRVRQNAMRKLHCRIADVRKDAIHKATTAIANSFSTIVIEDLNASGMAKNHRLAGSILDASFREVRRQIEYKVAMRGGRVVIADRFFPSSKTCSVCKHVVDSLPLNVRSWSCDECGSRHDRDVNAAINLEFLVGPARPEPLADKPSDTRGEMEALADPQGSVKPLSMNREFESLPKW